MSTQPYRKSRATHAEGRLKKPFDWLPLLLILPAAVMMGVLFLAPISQAIQLSFFRIRLLQLARGGGEFVGLENYLRLLGDPAFWNSLRVTVLYSLGVVTAAYLIGLGLALLLNQRLPARGLLRTLIILPWAVPEVVAVMIFVWMLDAQYGIFNFFLIQLGLIEAPLAWLAEAKLALPAVIIVTVWKQFPLALLILLAGMQTIPEEHYEAARIDGANAWQRFRYITMPGLRSVNVVLILILILFSFRRVTIIYTMTAGGPARATETLAINTYNTAFQYQHLGYATTIGTVLLLFLLVFTLAYFKLMHRREDHV